MDTPALQYIVQSLIEKTIELNSNPPHQVEPYTGPRTVQSVHLFIRECWDRLDDVENAVPDLTLKSSPKEYSSGKMKFYRELEAELQHATNLFPRKEKNK